MKKIPVREAAGSAALLLFIMVLGSGCSQKNATSGQNAAAIVPEKPIFAVNTTVAVQGQIADYLALSGDIIAGSTVDAYSDVAGKVTRLYVTVGSRVARNQAIAAVDPSKPGMDYIPGITRAPIAGTIVSLPAQVGMTVSQAVALARIAGGNGLETRVYVAERFISKIALNQACEIILDAYPGDVFKGSITEISPTVDPASRTMEVRINVSNQGSRLKAGMFAKVRIITEQKNGIVKIPATAIISRFGEDYVFTVETDSSDPAFQVARKQIITPGISVDGVLEIREGLAADKEIVVRGQTLLEDGSRINIIDRVQPLTAD
jgi:multidrug efflux pump subunit AcrA (membrane-fusion protein)